MTDKGELCQAITCDGSPCQARPLPGSDLCVFHDPSCAAKRAEGRRAGGIERSRKVALLPAKQPDIPLKTIADLVKLQELTINALLRGKLSTRLATTIFYGTSVLASLIQRGSLGDRLAAIESIISRPPSSRALAGNLENMDLEFEKPIPKANNQQDTRSESGPREEPESPGGWDDEDFERDDRAPAEGDASQERPEGLGVEVEAGDVEDAEREEQVSREDNRQDTRTASGSEEQREGLGVAFEEEAVSGNLEEVEPESEKEAPGEDDGSETQPVGPGAEYRGEVGAGNTEDMEVEPEERAPEEDDEQ